MKLRLDELEDIPEPKHENDDTEVMPAVDMVIADRGYKLNEQEEESEDIDVDAITFYAFLLLMYSILFYTETVLYRSKVTHMLTYNIYIKIFISSLLLCNQK